MMDSIDRDLDCAPQPCLAMFLVWPTVSLGTLGSGHEYKRTVPHVCTLLCLKQAADTSHKDLSVDRLAMS